MKLVLMNRQLSLTRGGFFKNNSNMFRPHSSLDSLDRPDLMFYELNTWDPLGTTPWKRSVEENLNGTFDSEIDILAAITSVMDPDAQFADSEANTVMIDENTVIATVQTVAEIAKIGIPNLLPDG